MMYIMGTTWGIDYQRKEKTRDLDLQGGSTSGCICARSSLVVDKLARPEISEGKNTRNQKYRGQGVECKGFRAGLTLLK